MIAALYERHNDAVGNRAFEFDVSTHTIRDDIRVLELEHPIYTRLEQAVACSFWIRVYCNSDG